MIAMRLRAGPIAGLLLAVALAASLLPVAVAERLLGLSRPLAGGDRAPITVRLPDEGRLRDPSLGERLGGGRLVTVRGQRVDAETAALVNQIHARQPGLEATLAGLGLVFGLIGLLVAAYLRSSHRGRMLRLHVTVLGSFVALAVAGKLMLLLTPLSWFLVPVGTCVLLAVALVDRHAGLGAAVALGLIGAALLPFDPSVAIVLGAQGLGAALGCPAGGPRKARHFLGAGLVAGCAAAAAYLATTYLYNGRLPDAGELADPLRSSAVAAFLAGPLSGLLALLLRAPVLHLGGELSRGRLVELADLRNPLLEKIAREAPGTWQHSLAMANLAEIAANAIGANALLVRVGAYYHDLGKSLQPQYYIENLAAGQKSPHEELPPETSADAIFAHVTEGVRLAREQGLPPAVIDFMHMHHGDGLLEYFWGKCQEEGNPRGLDQNAFRYPGLKPQSRETAILAICDAVEAASRTLPRGDARAIEALVQRIVYGKLHNGQLDESGLTVAELKKLANTLVDTLKHAHHGRIEYPWQKEERQLAAAAAPPPRRLEASGRFVLDSADRD
jgi:putative nucleotidyltransferase with HDIG domain